MATKDSVAHWACPRVEGKSFDRQLIMTANNAAAGLSESAPRGGSPRRSSAVRPPTKRIADVHVTLTGTEVLLALIPRAILGMYF